jgi:hypothetical protein
MLQPPEIASDDDPQKTQLCLAGNCPGFRRKLHLWPPLHRPTIGSSLSRRSLSVSVSLSPDLSLSLSIGISLSLSLSLSLSHSHSPFSLTEKKEENEEKKEEQKEKEEKLDFIEDGNLLTKFDNDESP